MEKLQEIQRLAALELEAASANAEKAKRQSMNMFLTIVFITKANALFSECQRKNTTTQTNITGRTDT